MSETPAAVAPGRRSRRRAAVVIACAALVLAGGRAYGASVPSTPTSVTAAPSGSSATVSWRPPTINGASAIIGYRIGRDGVDTAGTPAWSTTVAPTARSATFRLLRVGTTYHVTVQAINGAGGGAPATVTVTITAIPSQPGGVRATVSGTSATLTWSPPANGGTSAVTGYSYGRDGVDAQGSGPWTGTGPASARSATFRLLQPGKTYRLTVRATNASGNGPVATTTVVVPTPDPSGQPMPVGDVPGWKQVFTEDFTTDLPLGSWPGAYGAKWADYTGGPDTSGTGWWDATRTVSASGGAADYSLHPENGTPQCAAILPRLPAQTYGRYEVRFQVDPGLRGWSSAWLLWPDDDGWPQHGEMDWPEGELTGSMQGFMHHADPAGGQDAFDSGTTFASGWHTATTEWLPGSVAYYLDGRLVGSSTAQVSSYPMHWVLQSETAYGAKPTTAGHIKIDWAVVYSRA